MSTTPYRFQPKNSTESQSATSFPSIFQGRQHGARAQDRTDSNDGTSQTAFPSAFGGRERRDRKYEGSPHEYAKWKTTEQRAKPLTADDFPPLGSAQPRTNPVIAAGPSLAERLKVTIAKEEEEASIRRFRKDNDEEKQTSWSSPTTLTLGRLYQSRQQKKLEEEAQREAEREAEEANYQWQVSRDIVRESEEDYPPYADTTEDEHEDASCFPADDEEAAQPRTPLYR